MTLKWKSLLAGLLMTSFLIIVGNLGYCASSKLTSVNDIDMVDVSAYMKNDSTLYVKFFFKNFKHDQLVFWRGDRTQASCNVYELIGKSSDKRKGRLMGSIKNHDLNEFSQGIYIDVTTTKEKWGLVECSWTFGGRYFNGQDDFQQHYIP